MESRRGVEGIETLGVHQGKLAAIYSDAGAVALIVVNIFGGILPGDADGAEQAFRPLRGSSSLTFTVPKRRRMAARIWLRLPLGRGK